jgi:hypothetical protein
MKYPIILIAVILSASTPKLSGNANVRKVQGIEVYIMSEPTRTYQVVDSGKIIATLTGQCHEGVNQAVKKAAKANAHAVIYHLESSKWEAIKFE